MLFIIESLLTASSCHIRIIYMKTVSFSLDSETEQGIAALAKQAKLSRSDVVRAMYARMRLDKTFEEMQAQAEPLLAKLGLETEDDIAAYIKRKD